MADSAQTKTTLKSYFETGMVPTQQQFADLITTFVSLIEAQAPTVLTYGATVAPDCADGLFRKMTLTGDLHLDPPTNPSEGMKLEIWFTCDGTARAITFDTLILIPSDSGFTSPKALTINKTYIVLLKYSGSSWYLVSVVGGY